VPAGAQHLIVVVADHFEPSWTEHGQELDWRKQLSNVERWCERATAIGRAVRDADGTPFRHTYFYPAEQYHPRLVQKLAELPVEGVGEIEVHLHHGVDSPDNAKNLRRVLIDFRDVLAEDHKCLSRLDGKGIPRYAFVHGNLALGNSAGGRFCGVDSEMEILSETGCYADLTLPSAPDQSQVRRVNAIYECGRPLHERKPHRTGPSVRTGGKGPRLPLMLTGPLVFNWRRRVRGIPLPRLDDGALAANQPLDLARLDRWRGARIHVEGRPEWVFLKLYCHAFFHFDESSTIGNRIREFWDEVQDYGSGAGRFTVHFATAREAFNIVMAAIDGHAGDPAQYRDYRLQRIMHPCGAPPAGSGMGFTGLARQVNQSDNTDACVSGS
jgi:hypothetical protein